MGGAKAAVTLEQVRSGLKQNISEARRHRVANDDAIEIAGDNGLFWTAWFDSWAAAVRGDLDAARREAERGMDSVLRSGGQAGAIPMHMALGAIELWSGAPSAAHERVDAARRDATATGFGVVGAMGASLWSCDIEALLALERDGDAQSIAEELAARAERCGNPHAQAVAWRCRALVRAAAGESGAALQALDAALERHHERPLPVALGRTLLEKGSIERRLRRKHDAQASLQQALTCLEPLGARHLVARASDELTRIGLRRSQPATGLTAAQQRVIEMVASGQTNRQIATTLHMSQRSVEAHLTQIYRHHHVRSRAELVAATAQRQAGPATPGNA